MATRLHRAGAAHRRRPRRHRRRHRRRAADAAAGAVHVPADRADQATRQKCVGKDEAGDAERIPLLPGVAALTAPEDDEKSRQSGAGGAFARLFGGEKKAEPAQEVKAAQAVTVALHHGVDEKGHWRKRLDVAIGEVHCSHAASFWSAYVQFCAPSVEVLQLSMNRNVHLWRKWPLLAKECDLVLTDRWMLLSKYQLKLFRYSAILLDAGGMHELAMSIGASPPAAHVGRRRRHPIAMRVEITVSLTLCGAAEGQADEERFGHHRHSEASTSARTANVPRSKRRSAFGFGPIRFLAVPDSILSDVLKRVHSSSVSFVEPLLHALLQEREVLLGVVRRTRRQLTELHEMSARDETRTCCSPYSLPRRCSASTVASTAHLLPSDMVGAATRTAEVATRPKRIDAPASPTSGRPQRLRPRRLRPRRRR